MTKNAVSEQLYGTTENKEEAVSEKEGKFLRTLAEAVILYAIVAIVFVVLFNWVLMLNLIPSGSMESTLMTDDVVIATRYDVGKVEDIRRYDIIVFIPPDDLDTLYIKRVIGLPGETIEVKDGQVYADGVKLDNSFTNGPQNSTGDGVYVVPEGCFFMMGDNRNKSKDSRFWEHKYVPIENFVGKARVILFPFNRIGTLDWEGGR
ncbi:MAG: signal peptidase I [Lachnospiraceae bacterium]|nr:signal peptidase I [Lachnospiraceae bacterium]